MKRKIAVIMAADIAGYSRLVAEDEEDAVRRLASYRAVFDELIERYGGRIFNTAGDAVLSEFASAVDAVRCAVDVQESLRTRNLAYPASRQMSFRIGINIGDVIEREGDLLGDGVNIAARLESVATPGGICISRSVHESVANKMSVRFSDRGEQQLKNIPDRVRAYTIVMEDKEQGQSDMVEPVRRAFEKISLRMAGAGLAAVLVLAGAVHLLSRGGDEETAPPGDASSQTSSGGQQAALQPEASPPSPATAEPAVTPPLPAVTDQPPSGSGPAVESAPAAATPDQPAASSSEPAATAAAEPVLPTATEPPSSSSASPAVETPPVAVAPEPVPAPAAPSDSTGRRADPLTAKLVLQRNWSECLEGTLQAALIACQPLAEGRLLEGEELAKVQLKYAQALRDNQQSDKALSFYTQALAVEQTADAYHGRAIAYYDQGQFEPAIKDLDEVIRLEARNAEAHNDRAWIRFQAGDPRLALRDADRALELSSSKGNYWDTRAHIHEALGNRDAAVRDYRKALSLNSKLQSSRDGLARLGATP